MENPVTLFSAQEAHTEKLESILKLHLTAIDLSVMGSGKTHVSSHILANGVLQGRWTHSVVVCPHAVADKWRQMRDTFGLPIRDIIGYEALRGQSGRQPKHGLLSRNDEEKKTVFEPTALLAKYLDEGLLLIADEFHHVKNKGTAQQLALAAMGKAIRAKRNSSRIILLSGTPFDKHTHVIAMLNTIGILKSDKMAQYDLASGITVLEGAGEIRDHCARVNPKLTAEILEEEPFGHGNYARVCYRLWLEVLLPVMTSAMPSPKTGNKVSCFNGYHNLSADGRKLLDVGIGKLASATNYDEKTETVASNPRNEGSFGEITRALVMIEKAKAEIFVRRALEELRDHPRKKVVLFFNYSETLYRVRSEIQRADKSLNILVLTGDIKKAERPAILAAFQQHNTDYRILLCNKKITSEGIDLDDTDGKFPRIGFTSADYDILKSHQIPGRFDRMTSKSDATVIVVYGKSGKKETSILAAMARKSKVMKENLKKQKEEGVVFPGDYPIIEESDDGPIGPTLWKYEPELEKDEVDFFDEED